MQTEVVYDDLASVGIYDKYDLDSYMSPIWSGNVVHNETVMFVGIDDKASLLYDADRIFSVRSYDLSVEYVEGVDYDYVDGKLVGAGEVNMSSPDDLMHIFSRDVFVRLVNGVMKWINMSESLPSSTSSTILPYEKIL